MEKEYTSHAEFKAQLEQYKQLLVEMGKPLDTCKNDNLPSTSSLPEGEVKALLEVRQVAATTKSWAQINASKIRLFLQNTMKEYKGAVQVGGALASLSQQWEQKLNMFSKQFRVLSKVLCLGEEVIIEEDLLGGDGCKNL